MSNPRRKGWSNAQRRCFTIASRRAGWNDEQRYIAMRHVGCRDFGDLGRPSVSHERNTNAQFEQVMAIAESHAEMNGDQVHPPRDKASWKQAASRGRERQIGLATAIADEACDRLPAIFKRNPLSHAVAHVTKSDCEEFGGRNLDDIKHCDGGQVYRVVECLRAWVGRYFADAGLTPRSFTQPAEVNRRVARNNRRSAPMEGREAATQAGQVKRTARARRDCVACAAGSTAPDPGGRVGGERSGSDAEGATSRASISGAAATA